MAVATPNPTATMLKMVKDSGVLIEGIYQELLEATTYEEAAAVIATGLADDEKYLGLTRGGVAFSHTNESRVVEYDGRRVRFKRDFTIDGASPQLTTNLLKHDIGNLQRAFPMCTVTREGSRISLKPRLGTPQDGDYMDDLCWVRDFTDDSISVDVLLNCINTGDGSKSGADRSESELAVTFVANADSFEDVAHSPCDMLQFLRTPPNP